MVGSFRLLLVRHGAAEANHRGAFIGHTDQPLSEAGHQQARHLVSLVKSEKPAVIISSPLARARETAGYLAAHFQLPLQIEDRLIEQHFGSWENRVFFDVRKEEAAYFAKWVEGPGDPGPPRGESVLEVMARVAPWYQELAETYRNGETLVAVCHAGVLQALICVALNTPPRNFWPYKPATGTLSELQFQMGKSVLIRMGVS